MPRQKITRRAALTGLGGIAGAAFSRSPARADGTTLTVLSHEAMKGAASRGPGGDVLAAWRKANNCEISWITLDTQAIGDRLQREASLSQTSIDVAYAQTTTPQVLSLMEPLEPYLAAEPIAGVNATMDDFPETLVQALKYQNTLRGLPVRVATLGLFYNEALFEERGITAPPKTIEEFAEVCRKLTFARADGGKVTGLLFSGIALLSDGYTPFARCFGGDYITPDLKLLADQPPVAKSLAMLAGLYKDGALSPTTLTASPEDIFNWMQQGRAAIIGINVARLPSLNDPHFSKYPGRIKLMDWPLASDLVGKTHYAGTLEPWSLVLPKSAAPARRKLAWSFIRELMGPDATVNMALNGNGPTRLSAYSDPRMAPLGYMGAMGQALKYGHITVPSFPNGVRVNDIFVEAAQSVVLGRKPAEDAMHDAVARAGRLV